MSNLTKGYTLSGASGTIAQLHQLVEDADINAALFTGKTAKTTPVNTDVLLLADSASSYAPKKITVQNLVDRGTSFTRTQIVLDGAVPGVFLNETSAVNYAWFGEDNSKVQLQKLTTGGAYVETPFAIDLASDQVELIGALQITSALPVTKLIETAKTYSSSLLQYNSIFQLQRVTNSGGATKTLVQVDLASEAATLSGALNVTGLTSCTGGLKPPVATVADNAAGTPGEIKVDANYLYVCTAPTTWKRIDLSSY